METICFYPFTSIYSLNNGNYRVCCHSDPGIPSDEDPEVPVTLFKHNSKDVWNNKFYRQLRLDLVKGIRNPACAKCWQMEDNGEFSYRQASLSELTQEKYQEFIADTLQNNGALSTMPNKLLQIKLGNLCNLKCITCNQAASSLIQKEVNDWKKKKEKLPTFLEWVDHWGDNFAGFDENTDFKTVYENLKDVLTNVEEIQLVGGEPLVNPVVPILIKNLIKEDLAKNLKIYFISNCTKLTDKMLKNLSKFKSATISTSWDHIDPEKFKFIRYPANYKNFKNTVEKILTTEKINAGVSFTVSIFNIFDLEEIIDEFESISQTRKQYFISLGYVENPSYMSVRYLEPDQKSEVLKRLNNYLEKNAHYKIFKENKNFYKSLKSLNNVLYTPHVDFRGKYILNDTNTSFDFVVRERTRVLKMYDKVRETNYKLLFPYIKDYE